jgi:EmrB/QacA subfamily drug resistance transporter
VSGLQWVIDAYLLVLACLLLLSGSLGDRFGRRRMFIIGLTVFGIGSLLCSLAPTLPLLVVARILQAVGGSMLNPNSLSIVSSVFTDRRERAGAVGVWGGVFGLSAAMGPILGGVLIETLGYRSIFWVNIPVCVVAAVLAWRLVPESRSERPRRLDPPGQVLAVIVLGALVYGIIEGPTDGWTSPVIVGSFAAALAALVAFVKVEQRRDEPLLELRFFRSPPLSGAAIIAVLGFVILAGYLFLNTLYLQEVRGDSALVAGLSTVPATVIIALVAPLTGRLVGRRGARSPLVAAGMFLAAGTAVLAFDTPNVDYGYLAAGYVLLGLGFGLVNPPITNTALAGMPPPQAAVAAAVTSTSRQVGSALGVAVLGSVVTSRFQREIALRLRGLSLPAGVRTQVTHATIGSTGLSGAAARDPAVVNAVHQAFTDASHAGWLLAAGCGVAISVAALVTTGPGAVARARRAVGDL